MTSRGITAGLFRTRKVLSVTERLLWWGCQDSDKRDLKGVSVLCDTNIFVARSNLSVIFVFKKVPLDIYVFFLSKSCNKVKRKISAAFMQTVHRSE